MNEVSSLDRRNKLAQLIMSQGGVKVGELASKFGVSTETIRRDLIFLERKGFARKGHGGAVAMGSLLEMETPFAKKTYINMEAKTAIATRALQLVKPGDVVFLDAGSTVFLVAKLMAQMEGLTIFTNNINAAQAISASANEVYLVGGKIRPSSQAAVGMWCKMALESVTADVAFLGADGIRIAGGPCTASMDEADIKRAMIENSKKKYLLCDQTKFERNGLFQFANWGELDAVIIDAALPCDQLEGTELDTKFIVARA